VRMRHRPTACVIVVLASGLAGCGGGSSSPTAPSQQAQTQPQAPASATTLTGVTLHGVVAETTDSGDVPVVGATVYCDACGAEGHTWLRTDTNGYYSFSGDVAAGGGIWLASGGAVALWVAKEGYRDPPGLLPPPGLPAEPGWRVVSVSGDTRFDIALVRE
jgi:hypothetical protein